MPDAPVPDQDPDGDAVARAKAGDFAAFEALVTRHERRIFTLARRLVRCPQDAEEVAQETFLSAMEHLGAFEGRSTFKTWLSRVAVNHALGVLRKRRGRAEVALAEAEEGYASVPHPHLIAPWREDPLVLAERAETREILSRAIDSLDEKHRLVFVLRDVEGFSTLEAAEALGISVANAKVRLLRARLALRERLTGEFGDLSRAVVPPHDHG